VHSAMRWFSSAPSPDTVAAPVPDRSAREQCWASRDAYFGCLDKKSVQVPGQESAGSCQKENDKYKQHCAASWVSRPACETRRSTVHYSHVELAMTLKIHVQVLTTPRVASMFVRSITSINDESCNYDRT
jgi:hypothetical protein